MKKKIAIILSAIAILAVAVTLLLVFLLPKDKVKNEHVHAYDTEWSNDGEYHWYECQNDGCDAKEKDKAKHEDNNGDGKCDICGYKMKDISQTVAVESVTINKNELTLTAGDSETLTVNILPVNATDKSVSWTSSDNAKVTVSDGLVKAVSAGTATITVKTSNNKTAECKVTVKHTEVVAESVNLNKNVLTLTVGDSETLTATLLPSDVTDRTLIWDSSDKTKVTVTDGTVTAVAAGEATITVKTANGKTATCSVTVNLPTVLPESVTLNKSQLNLTEGSSETLTVIILPSTVTDKSVSWVSSDNNVVTVTDGLITAVAEGTATVTVKTVNNKIAECTVTVEPAVIRVENIFLDKSELTLTVGKTYELSVTISPADAEDKSVSWASSNNAVATVDNGTITALSVGTADITVTTTDGNKSAVCSLNVVKPVQFYFDNYYIGDKHGYEVRTVSAGNATEAIIPSEYNGEYGLLPVISIKYGAFDYCSNLTDITLPDSIVNISDTFEDTAYYKNEANWQDGVLYIGKHLIKANKDVVSKDYSVKEGTLTIAGSAFLSTFLTSVTLPESLKGIGGNAFQNCRLNGLTVIPDSVEFIGSYAFRESGIKTIVLGSGVKYIARSAFYSANALETVYYKGSMSEWNNISKNAENDKLIYANRYYYSESQPTEDGNFWHYDTDGVTPVKWEITE